MSRFRTYKNGELEFCPGVNGIIGISQSGKTNIIRALRWISTLTPSGTGYVYKRKAKTDSKVEVECFDGNKASLEKGLKTTGTYIVNGKAFRKFGRTIPQPVEEALNLSAINFHGQFDSPFLVMSKPSEISRVINNMTGLDDFDKWIDAVNEKSRNSKTELKLLETDLEADLIELESMDRLGECEPYLKKASELKREYISLQKKFELVEDIHEKIKQLNIKIEKAKRVTRLKPEIKKLDKIRKRLYRFEDKYDITEKVINQEHLIDMAIEEHRSIGKEYLKLLKIAGKCPICKSSIKQIIIKRISDEIRSTFRFTRDNENPGWKIR